MSLRIIFALYREGIAYKFTAAIFKYTFGRFCNCEIGIVKQHVNQMKSASADHNQDDGYHSQNDASVVQPAKLLLENKYADHRSENDHTNVHR